MDTKDWEIITILHQTKSLTQAADRLYMTQPALSVRLRNIERFFATQVVVRGKKGVHFTREGEILLQEAQKHLQNLRDIRDKLVDMQSTLSGELRIGATNFVTKYVLLRIMQEFKKIYPAVEFSVSTEYSKELLPLVENGDVHVAFIRGRHSWGGESHLLFKEPVSIISKERVTIEELPALPMIRWKVDPSNEELLTRWWRERFKTPPRVAMYVDRPDTCYDLVASGFGYSFLPASVLPFTTKLHQQEMFFESRDPVERSVWMIYLPETAQLRIVRAFVEMVRSTEFSYKSLA